MPATPRASSDTDLRLPSPSTVDKPTAAGNVPANPHQEPIPNRSLLPAAVLGTTFNDPHAASSNAVANGSIASPQLAANTLPAMNSPASIAQSNPPIQAPSAGAPIGQTSSVPVMADYHLPARAAAPFSNSIPAGINPTPNADPVLEARRQSLPAISTNTPSAASNFHGAASFDGGIMRPLDSIPR